MTAGGKKCDAGTAPLRPEEHRYEQPIAKKPRAQDLPEPEIPRRRHIGCDLLILANELLTLAKTGAATMNPPDCAFNA